MISFTEFIETLRHNDVSSIGLEFHPPAAYAPEKEASDIAACIFGKSIALAGVKFVKVDFFPPQQKPAPALDGGKKTLPQEPIVSIPAAAAAPAQPAAEPAKPEPELAAAAPVKTQEPEKPVQTEKRSPVEPEKPKPDPEKAAEAAKPKRESKKAKAEAAAAAPEPRSEQQAAALPKPADVYDVFVETVEQDDGTKSDVKRALIGRMTLDDMLRVNAGFQLGLDTDVATEALRAELLTCFI